MVLSHTCFDIVATPAPSVKTKKPTQGFGARKLVKFTFPDTVKFPFMDTSFVGVFPSTITFDENGLVPESNIFTAVLTSLFNICTPGVPVDFISLHVIVLLSTNGALIKTC